MIYLDNAATSPIYDSVLKKIIETWQIWGNPSSLHKIGKQNKEILEESRNILKKNFNIKNNAELIFLPSATVANNLIIQNNSLPLITSKFEHPSILKIPNVETINLNILEEYLQKQKYLVSLSLVNNESGMIIASNKITKLVNQYGSKLHIDASQAKHIDFEELNCHHLTISSHKIGGPVGIACLVTKTLLSPIIFGGGQEFNVFSGTEAIPLIAGFAEASNQLKTSTELYQKLNNLVKLKINPKYILNNFIDADFENHIICLLTYNVPGTEMFTYMDINNIAISYGSACSSGALNKLNIIKYFNVPSENGIRISFGYQNNENEILEFINKFNQFMQ